MAIAKLTVDLEARLAGFEKDLKQAATASERTAQQITSAFGSVKAGLAGVLAGIGIKELASLALGIVDGIDALNDLKDATGSSIENLSALDDVAARTGTSFDSLSSTLVKFNKVLGEAKEGSEAANILKQLGLNAEELKRLDPAEALRQTAVALAGFADDGNKARVIQELFGKSVQEAAPFLKDLATQTKLNATVTTEQAQAAEDFNKQLFELQKNAKDAGRALTSELIVAINQLFDAFSGKAVGGESPLSEWLVVPLQAVSVLGANVAFVLKGIGTEIGGIAAQAAALASLDFGRARSIGEAMREDAKAAREEFDRLEQRLLSVGRALPQASYSNEGRARAAALASVGDIAEKDKKREKEKVSELEKYIQGLDKAREAALNLSAEEQAYADIYLGRIGKVTDEQEKRIIETVRETEEIKKRNKEEAELQALIANSPLAKLEQQRKAQVALAEAYEKGRFGLVGSAKALEAYSAAASANLPKVAEEAEEAFQRIADESNEFAKEAAANIQDSLGETLKRSMKGDFHSIEQLWKDMLLNMVAQAAATKLNTALFGADFGKTGNFGGLLGQLFNGYGGSAVPTTGAYDPGLSGYNIPVMAGTQSAAGGAGRMGAMSAERTVVIDMRGATYQIGADVSRGEVIKAIEQRNAQLEERIRRSARQGSL